MATSETRSPKNDFVGVNPTTGRCSLHDYIWNGGVEFAGSSASIFVEASEPNRDEHHTVLLPARDILGSIANQLIEYYKERATLKTTELTDADLITRWAAPVDDKYKMLVRTELKGMRQIPLVSTQVISRGTDGTWLRGEKTDITKDSDRLARVCDSLGSLAKLHLDTVLGDSYQDVLNIQSSVRQRGHDVVPVQPRRFWPFGSR